jgi:hypothetical protein
MEVMADLAQVEVLALLTTAVITTLTCWLAEAVCLAEPVVLVNTPRQVLEQSAEAEAEAVTTTLDKIVLTNIAIPAMARAVEEWS